MITTIVLYCLVGIAVIIDVRTRKIPNWLTFSGLAIGLTLSFILGNLTGLLNSFLGMIIGIAIFLPFFAMGGLGGGDVKLLGMIGAFCGYPLIINIAIYSALSGGLISLLHFGKLIQIIKKYYLNYFYKIPMKKDKTTAIPYSVAILLGIISVNYLPLFFK